MATPLPTGLFTTAAGGSGGCAPLAVRPPRLAVGVALLLKEEEADDDDDDDDGVAPGNVGSGNAPLLPRRRPPGVLVSADVDAAVAAEDDGVGGGSEASMTRPMCVLTGSWSESSPVLRDIMLP